MGKDDAAWFEYARLKHRDLYVTKIANNQIPYVSDFLRQFGEISATDLVCNAAEFGATLEEQDEHRV